jgi:hypothetical protein
MDLMEVLSNIKSEGSGTGVSYYMKRCGAQFYLDQLYPRESGFNAQVGTIFHKLAELYYKRQLGSTVLPLDDHADFARDPVQEALRAFSAYVRYFPPDEFDVVACELPIPEVDEAGNLTAQGVQQAKALEAFIGVPYTFRPDMAVMFSQEQAENFYVRRRMTVQPGVLYLMDHKTHEKADSGGLRKYAEGQQVPCYTRAWNELSRAGLLRYEGKDLPECVGLLINNVVRHSEMSPEATGRRQSSFSTYLLDVGSDHDMAVARQAFRYQKARLEAGVPDVTACNDWGRCSHLTSGACDRLKVFGPQDLVQLGRVS